jgi:putative addiction module component (TIGR02574 family)
MPTTFASLGLNHLSEDDKWNLVRDLGDELEASRGIPGGFATLEEFHAELDRRIAEDDANPEDAIPWEVVDADATRRLKARRGEASCGP